MVSNPRSTRRALRHALGTCVAAALLLAGLAACGNAPGQPDERSDDPPGSPTVIFPTTGIGPHQLAILVNDQDPQSIEVAAYYQQRRRIPEENVIRLSFPSNGSDNLSVESFSALQEAVALATPATVQAYAVSWTYPSRVDCMSITTALAFGGFDESFCNRSGACAPTGASPYFDSRSVAPFDDLAIRPTMMLAGGTTEDVKALIDRGIDADDSYPKGKGWLIRTTDTNRAVRYPQFVHATERFSHAEGLDLTYVDNSSGEGTNFIEEQKDVLFYFTGLVSVPAVETNVYLPGAVADHLTSYGGSIPANGQMNVLAWLGAGVTASYGTLREPCNYTMKFPNASMLIDHYFRGSTVIEAYWKSVEWPGEGLFVGEPLARPWGSPRVHFEGGSLRLETTMLVPGERYMIASADHANGPWTTVRHGIGVDKAGFLTIEVTDANAPFYRLSTQVDDAP